VTSKSIQIVVTMSSSCYFQFKSQKEPTRVTFDGTGVSVFELKREIINISKLGDGSDFDLSIYNKDTNEGEYFVKRQTQLCFKTDIRSTEYDDDTAVVPRSTSVIARRLPASKPGQGRAARYVSGRMPVTAKNSHRTETHSSSTTTGKVATGTHGAAAMDKAVTEEERIAAMFQMGADQWEEQKQHMAGYVRPHRAFNYNS
jgi:protein MPE1